MTRFEAMWSASANGCFKILHGHSRPVTDISFSPLTAQFASSSRDKTIALWDGNQKQQTLIGHEDIVTGAEFTSDGRILASCSADRSVRFWFPQQRTVTVLHLAHLLRVNSLSFSPDDKRLVTGSNDTLVKLWDMERTCLLVSLWGHTSFVNSVKYSPRGNYVASAAHNGIVKFWDINTGQSIMQLPPFISSPSYLAINPNNYMVAVATNCGSVRVYDIRYFKFAFYLLNESGTRCVSWYPIRNFLLTCGSRGVVRLLDINSGRRLCSFSAHWGAANVCKFSPDGNSFVTGGEDHNVMVWGIKVIDVKWPGSQIRTLLARGRL